MFASFPFAPRTTQMGKEYDLNLDLQMIEVNNSNSFIIPQNASSINYLNCNEPIKFNLDNDNATDEPNLDFQSDFFNDIQRTSHKKLSNIDQNYCIQSNMSTNFSDLNLIEENFPNLLPNITIEFQQYMLEKAYYWNFDFANNVQLGEIFVKNKSIIEEELHLQKENPIYSSPISSISYIEENCFDSCNEDFNSISNFNIPETKKNFELEVKPTIDILPKSIHFLILPTQHPPKHNDISQPTENQLQSNEPKTITPEAKKSKIELPNNSLKVKCSKNNQENKPEKSNSTISRSRLFPKASKSVTPIKNSTDTRKALIIDERLISLPGFQQAFADYRVIFRSLKSCDIEINIHTCVILRPLVDPYDNMSKKTKKNFNVNRSQLVQALTLFERVFIVIAMEGEMVQYQNISKDILKLISNIYGNQISVRIRQFPTYKSAFNFIHSLVDDSQIFLRDCESLHEHLLSLFPTISKSLAQAILRKGNPITDCSIILDEFPQMNIIPFKHVLDTLSILYQKNKKKKQIIENDADDEDRLSHFVESNPQPLFAPSNKKISAPLPSSIFIKND